MGKQDLPQKELHKIFQYEKEIGGFKWKIYRTSNAKIGDVAGCLNKSTGRWQIRYCKQNYKAHRLVWVYHYGAIPFGKYIDHIDRNPLNNKIENLRLCTKSENMRNVGMQKNNKSGYKGVFPYNNSGKFYSRIVVEGVSIRLGVFDTEEEASLVYEAKARELHGVFYRDSTGEEETYA